MAKRKEKIIINKGSLSSTTIGTISNSKKSFIPLIFTMIIFVLAIIFMPEIVEVSKNYIDFSNGIPKFNFNGTGFNNSVNNSNNNNNNNGNVVSPENNGNNNLPSDSGNTNPPLQEEENISNKYEYTSDLLINTDKFSLKNILVNDNDISFELTNLQDSELDLNNYNYFIEFYNENIFIDRVILDKEKIGANTSKVFSIPFHLNNVTHLSLIEIPKSDYSTFSVSENENNRGLLTCTRDNETIVYETFNQKLINITDTFVSDFSNFNNYNQMANVYKGIEGYDVKTSIEGSNVVLKISIALADANIDSTSSKYYGYETKINVVRFEMKARGYSCN